MARSQDLRQNATETFPTESRELAVALAARGAFSGGADEGRSRRVDGLMKERGEVSSTARLQRYRRVCRCNEQVLLEIPAEKALELLKISLLPAPTSIFHGILAFV